MLLAAAREVFVERGFDAATVRMIASRSGVDAAMVNHWFGGKQGLFAAIMELPFDPLELLEHIVAGDPEALAERLIRTFVPLWDAHEGGFTAVLLSIANQDLADQMGEFFVTTIFGRLAEVIGVDQTEVRAGLCASQILGIGLVRYVLKLEPIASADVDTMVRLVGPNLQRYLTGALD
jgi:AcrR family transcriptional regulator